MSLFRRRVFDNDDLFFRHPFVDRFVEDDDLDLLHAFHRSLLTQPTWITIADVGRGSNRGGKGNRSDPAGNQSTPQTQQGVQFEQPGPQLQTQAQSIATPTPPAAGVAKEASPQPQPQPQPHPYWMINYGQSGGVMKQLSPLLGSDLVETEGEYKIHVDLPGVEVSDVEVSLVEGKYLVIQAERKHVHEEEKDKVHTMERSYGKVQRRFRLPANADVEQAVTTFKNGVLSVVFPKKVVCSERNVRKLEISTA